MDRPWDTSPDLFAREALATYVAWKEGDPDWRSQLKLAMERGELILKSEVPLPLPAGDAPHTRAVSTSVPTHADAGGTTDAHGVGRLPLSAQTEGRREDSLGQGP